MLVVFFALQKNIYTLPLSLKSKACSAKHEQGMMMEMGCCTKKQYNLFYCQIFWGISKLVWADDNSGKVMFCCQTNFLAFKVLKWEKPCGEGLWCFWSVQLLDCRDVCRTKLHWENLKTKLHLENLKKDPSSCKRAS